MIEDTEVLGEIVPNFDAHVQKHAKLWSAYRDAYAGDFWKDAGAAGMGHDGSARGARRVLANYPIKMQVNHVLPWVHTYLDSLFHKKLRTMVTPPPIPTIDPAEDVVQPQDPESPNPARPADVVSAVLDAWLSTQEVETETQRGVLMGLLYPECAFKIGMVTPRTPSESVRSVWVDVLPPWECVWDRHARSFQQMRYVGHAYWISKEEFLERFPDFKSSDLDPRVAPDVLAGEERHKPATDRFVDKSYVRILEFTDLTATTKVGSKEYPGQFRVYLLDGAHSGAENKAAIKVGPPPFATADDQPVVNIIPQILLPLPEYPLRGAVPVANTYELNAEENFIHTFMVNAARRDAARHVLLQTSEWSDENIASLTDGNDMGVVKMDTDRKVDDTYSWMERQPLSSTMLQVLTSLQGARDASSSLSPLSRGQAIKYASAAEVHSLNRYSETTLGRIAKAMDDTVRRMLQVVLRVLAAAMDEAGATEFRIVVQQRVLTFQRSWLDERWDIEIMDSQTTPMSQLQKRQDFMMLVPVLSELSAGVAERNPMALALLRYVVDLYDLPADMAPEAIIAALPPPAPEPDPGMGGGGGGPEEALMQAVQAAGGGV